MWKMQVWALLGATLFLVLDCFKEKFNLFHVMDVLVGHVVKGLSYLHLTLWLLRVVCCADRDLFLSLSGSGGGNLTIYIKGQPAVLEGMGRLVCSRGCTTQCHICPLISWFLTHLFRVGLAWHTIGIYHSAISGFFRALSSSHGF